MLSITTNFASLIAQNSLTNSTVLLNQAIERMTTGFKINVAKDNAANYSISTSLSSQLSSYGVAQDNVAMGLDMLMTAEESLTLVSDHVSRIRDLAEQAANGTYGASSLNAIQAEVTARLNEAARIVSNTEYNGIKLFKTARLPTAQYNGFIEEVDQLSESEAIAQGYMIIKTADDLRNMRNDLDGKYILMNDIDLPSNWTAVGDITTPFTGEFNGNGYVIRKSNVGIFSGAIFGITEDALILNTGLEIDSLSLASGGFAYTIGGDINNCYTIINQSMNNFSGGLAMSITGSISNSYVIVNADTMGSHTGGLVSAVTGNISNSYTYISKPVTATDTTTSGFVYNCSGTIMTNCAYYNPMNPDLGAINLGGGTGLTTVNTAPPAQLADDIPEISFQSGIYSEAASQIIIDLEFDYSLSVDVSSSEAARNSLAAIDEVLAKISEKQTEYGSAYNRLENALESISVSIENLSSTQSTIRDADIAEVSSEYIRQQILQQASATLLATANQLPAIALQLI